MHTCFFQVPWSVAMGVYPPSYASPQNLLPDADARAELSHHLAHAWSAAALSPFDRGLIVVMDGMGESYGAMAKAEASLAAKAAGMDDSDMSHDSEKDNEHYYNDLRLMRETGVAAGVQAGAGTSAGFQQVPEAVAPHEAYREAESAYTFAPGQGNDAGEATYNKYMYFYCYNNT